MSVYVLDACALVAFLRKESGWERVKAVLTSAFDGTAVIQMHAFNLLEVYYDMYRSIGREKADEELRMIRKLPIIVHTNLSDAIFAEAGRLKANYRVSLADSIALAQTKITGEYSLHQTTMNLILLRARNRYGFCG